MMMPPGKPCPQELTPCPVDRSAFPLLVRNPGLVYVDNAATTHKPVCVLEAERNFYETANANVHRAAHRLAVAATDAFENARTTAARFLNAASPDEIIFTRGATEAINLVAQSWGRAQIKPGDEILLTELEHHANIVPWQLLAQETGARIRAVRIRPDGSLDLALDIDNLAAAHSHARTDARRLAKSEVAEADHGEAIDLTHRLSLGIDEQHPPGDGLERPVTDALAAVAALADGALDIGKADQIALVLLRPEMCLSDNIGQRTNPERQTLGVLGVARSLLDETRHGVGLQMQQFFLPRH